MGIKDLFGKKTNQILTKQQVDKLLEEVESDAYVVSESISREEFIPRVDLSNPANFARYGLAEKYYSDSIKSIYTTYPYDGSATEKIKWSNEASVLDRYILDNSYPRTTGYITLNTATSVSSTITVGADDFLLMASPQYVTFRGGPHRDPSVTAGSAFELSRQFPEKGGDANIYNPTNDRSTNLLVDGSVGNTVELFTKVDDLAPLVAGVDICLFDSWNGLGFADPNYVRFIVEYSRVGGFYITYKNGAAGYERQPIVPTATIMATNWQHLAVSVVDSGADSVIRIYVDGVLDTTTTVAGGAIGTPAAAAQTGMLGAIGSFLEAPTAAISGAGVGAGYGAYENLYFDEFRFWKTRRSSQEIGRNWIAQVNGGTNTDVSNTDLGVYYKFNEGIMDTVEINAVDANVLDYSGRISNGSIENYGLGARSTGSAIDEFTPAIKNTEFKDPIIYSDHPQVVSLLDTLTAEGRIYDYKNGTSIYKSIPSWITQEEEDRGGDTLKNLIQALSSYFDNLHMQIEALPHIKDVHYASFQEGDQPYAFAKDLLRSAGLIAPELFVESTILEELVSRGEDEVFAQKINLVKNLIYQNIYNNLSYIYKSKGTEKSFRNLLRCFGVDDELVKINMYADGVDHKIRHNVRHTAIKKKYADFNNPDRWSATVHQYHNAADPDTRSFILCADPVATDDKVDYLSFTVEAEAIFPKKPPVEDRYIAASTFISGSLFGMHAADLAAPATLTWFGADASNFQVYAMKESADSDNVFFRLVSLAGGYGAAPITLDSPVYKNVYDNEKWNFAVRFRVSPSQKETYLVDEIVGSTETTPGLPTPDVSYDLEFYGVNSTQDTVENEFSLSTTVASADALPAIRAAKRLYCGAHLTDFTGAVLQQSDAKISSVRFWFDYLDDDTIKYHSYDVSNSGRLRPDDPAYFGPTSLDGPTPNIEVPQASTLALDWNFDNVTGSDGAGLFVTADYSSGSATSATAGPYDWFSLRTSYQHSGQGNFFPASSNKVVDTDYISTAKQEAPEVASSSDMINILSQADQEIFTRDTRPIKYFFAAEKSMYQAISDEIIDVFAGIAHFNKLLGDPVTRYRVENKPLDKLRQIFFERQISDTATLEKYVKFYKWIDSSVDIMIEQIFPASANFSEEMRTLIESHVLERNKYLSKFPTLEMKQAPIEGQVFGIKEMLYDWEHGHATLPPSGFGAGDEDCLWRFQRVERSNIPYGISSGNPIVDADRETLRKAAIREVKGNTKLVWDGAAWVEQGPTFYDTVTAASYEGSTYAVRQLSRPYRFGVNESKTVHGGDNFNHGRKPVNEFIRTTTKLVTAAVQGLEINDSTAMPGNRTGNRTDPACIDAFTSATPPGPRDKFENARSVAVTDATVGGYENTFKGALGLPFNYYSTAPNDYTNQIRTNIHSDSYGDDNEIPMQGPFTNQWVGGNQHRHVTLTTTAQDTNRPELYTETTAGPYTTLRHPHSVSTTAYAARYTRNETAKRPLNIANIKTVAGATEDADSNELPYGNYTWDYEIVQTSGRSVQNRWYVKNNGVLPITTTSTTSTYVTGLYDYAIPDRSLDAAGVQFGPTDYVFVERFSAPGSVASLGAGSLDMEAAEKSPYSTVNYRNLMVRQHLDFWLSDHADQFGYRDTYIHDPTSTAVVGAWQKNNRNPLRRIILNIAGDDNPALPGIYAEKAIYDNFFVKHQIPRSDWQYTWVTGSALPNGLIDFGDLYPLPGFNSYPRLSGFASTYDNVSLDVSTSLLLSGSLNYTGAIVKDVDFAGLNTLIYDPTDFDTGLTGYDCLYCSNVCDTQSPYFLDAPSTILDPDLNTILLNRNGPYQYPSWKQIRTGERKYVRNLRKKNILSVQDRPSQGRIILTASGRRFTLTERFAPSFTNYIEPPCAWNQPMTTTMVNAADTTGIGVAHTYSNNLEMFANPHLTNRLEAIKCDRQVYDRLLDMYAPEIPQNAHAAFTSIAYGEYIYPKHRHVGLHTVRQRNGYSESAEKIRNNPTGYASVGIIGKAYIRTFWKNSVEDRKRLVGSYNALGYAFNTYQYNKHKQLDSVWALDDYTKYAPVDGEMGFPIPPTTSPRPSDDGIEVEYQILGDLGYVGAPRYEEWISGYSRVQTAEVVSTPEPSSAWSSAPELVRYLTGSALSTYVPLAYTPDILPTEAIDCMESSLEANPSVFSLAPVPSGVSALEGAALAAESILTGLYVPGLSPESATDTPRTTSITRRLHAQPRPSLQYLYNPIGTEAPERGWSWRTTTISGKSPWYDTYGDYAQDVRLMGQNYGVVPEFRMSQHMDFYVREKAGNFRAKNYNYLSIEGAELGRELSGDTTMTITKVFSRTGNGVYQGTRYPTSSSDDAGLDLIRNNAFYDARDSRYLKYKDYNQLYVTGSSTAQISDSVMVGKIFSKTTTDNKNPLGTFSSPIATTSAAPSPLRAPTTDWVRMTPYNGCLTSALRFNPGCEEGDYIEGAIENFGTLGPIDLYNPNAAAGDHGDAFTLSFWVQPEKEAMESCAYMGSVSLSGRGEDWVEVIDFGASSIVHEADFTEMGIWLKCPTVTAGLFNGTEYEGIGGLTFYMGVAGQPDPSAATATDNIFHFMKKTGAGTFIPAILPSDRMSHITLQYIPQQATGAGLNEQPRVMMWLDGERLYGTHPVALAAGNPSAYTVVEPGHAGPPTPYAVGTVGARLNNGCKLNTVVLGKGHLTTDTTQRKDYFKGLMMEFSLWKGILTENSMGLLYGKNTDGTGGGAPTNLLEDFYNYLLMSQYSAAADLNAHYGSTMPTILPTAYVMTNYSIPLSAANPMLAELPLWWRVGVPFVESISDSSSAYSDSFFDRHAHTDIVKYMAEVIKDHDDGTPQRRKRMRLQANVIKKLLPYNGFYPSQRSVQLGYLLKEDYFDNIALGNSDPDAFWDSQRLQSFVQPFFAPGILYNSIKSGIAVDWPAFSNETGLEPPNYGARLYLSRHGHPEGEERYYGSEAPRWYQPRTEPFSDNTLDTPAALTPMENCFTAQPKFTNEALGTNAGFVILDEPSLRIPFEGLLSPHSIFVNTTSAQDQASQELALRNIVLDIDGYDCEGNNIALRSPYFGADGTIEERSSTISLRRARWGVTRGVDDELGDTNILAPFYAGPWETTTAMINKNLAIELCDAINNDPSCLWIALRPSIPLGGGGRGGAREKTQTDFIVDYLNLGAFRIERSGLGESSEAYTQAFSQTTLDGHNTPITGRQSSGSFRIKLVYVGPPSVTQSTYDEFSASDVEADPRDLSANTKYNLLRRGALQGGLGGLTPKATITVAQTFSSLAGTSGYFTDSTGAIKLYSSLSTIGVKTVQSDGTLDTSIDSPLGVPSQTRGLYGGIENIEESSTLKVNKKPSQFFLMAPEYYTGSAAQIAEHRRYPSFSFNDKRASTQNLYSRGIHNFLAEIPSFFLEGERLTSFTSATEDQFEAMEAGKTYYMDVSLYKTEELNTMMSPQGRLDRSVGFADGKYFGPAFKYKDAGAYTHPRELIADPAQAPYTPSYFYGKTTARLSFTATESRKYTLDEIFAGLQIEEESEEVRKYFNEVVRTQRMGTSSLSHASTNNIDGCEQSPAYSARMPLASSVNLTSKGKVKDITYTLGSPDAESGAFVASSATDSGLSSVDTWVISTKFESPVLNFNNKKNKDYLKFNRLSEEPFSEGIGMWSGYGEVPQKNNGVFLEIDYSFKVAQGDNQTLAKLDNAGSLIDICKFTPSTQKVGRVAEEKTISEAIVLVPFLDEKQSSGPRTFTVDGKEVFAIDEDIYRHQKNNVEKGSPAVTSGSFGAATNIEETSISRMIKTMGKYNLPPTLNFADYGDSPFVMYLVEFSHKLDQQDLSDIWQGVSPTIATRAERESQEFVHDLSTVDFFGGDVPPEDVRWLVFRVKQKAKTNYYESYGSTVNDSRFDFNFNLGEDGSKYSYNWPYDFFSLIELSQIEGGVEIFDDETYDGVTSVFGPLPKEEKERIYNSPIGRSSTAITAKIKNELEAGQTKPGVTGSEFGADGANE